MSIATEADDAAVDATPADRVGSAALEQQGRRWLVWSFIFCPCHLPVSMAVFAGVFGGTAFGSLISRNTLGVGLVLGAVYAIGVGIGFRYLRAAAAAKDCRGGCCSR